MHSEDLGSILEAAVVFLRGLDRRRESVAEARLMAHDWATQHPEVKADLLVDQPPGSPRVDYDLLLTSPHAGTICITLCRDDTTPWLVSYADHWAANFVVTVNGQHVTIQHALREIALATSEAPHMIGHIVDRVLEGQALESLGEKVMRDELQEQVDSIRRAHGLEHARDTMRWLERHGFSREDLGRIAASVILSRRLKDRVTAGRVTPYFEGRRDDYDRVTATIARVRSQEDAHALVEAARCGGLLKATAAVVSAKPNYLDEATVTTAYAGDVREELRVAVPGAIVGPLPGHEGWLVAEVHQHEKAKLDARTIEAVRSAVYLSWLETQRNDATVTWHWA